MNRVVIIGNGFDLAHKQKTRYSDFANSIIRTSTKKASEKIFYEDELIAIARNHHFRGELPEYSFENDDFASHFFIKDYWELEPYKKGISRDPRPFSQPFVYFKKNAILSKMLIGSPKRWCDIEYIYFKELLRIARLTGNEQENAISELIHDFGVVKKSLANYLKNNLAKKAILEIQKLIDNNSTGLWLGKRPYVGFRETLFLNFNYTSTIDLYEIVLRDQIINIHGTLGGKIIFGYGNEHGLEFEEIEKLNDNRFLSEVKSFGYLQDNRYDHLCAFLEKAPFHVHIWGHSCGFSDGTLLRKIFTYKDNQQIVVFRHDMGNGQSDYIDIVQNISRHFVDKDAFRRLVIDEERSPIMPQMQGI